MRNKWAYTGIWSPEVSGYKIYCFQNFPWKFSLCTRKHQNFPFTATNVSHCLWFVCQILLELLQFQLIELSRTWYSLYGGDQGGFLPPFSQCKISLAVYRREPKVAQSWEESFCSVGTTQLGVLQCFFKSDEEHYWISTNNFINTV